MNIAHRHTHRVRGTKLKYLKVKENRHVLENLITLMCTKAIQCNEISTIIAKPLLLDSQILYLVVTYGVKSWVAIFDAEKTAYCSEALKLGGSWGNSDGLSLYRTWDVITEEIKLGFNAIYNRRIVSGLRVLQWKTRGKIARHGGIFQPREAEMSRSLQIWDQPGLHCKLQVRQDYI